MDWLRMASERAPSTRNLRALARQLNGNNRSNEAVAALLRALERDPYNLPTLFMLMNVWNEAQNSSEAEKIAARLIEVEKSPVYQVRALPELVPTETYYAREFLARRVESEAEKRQLLRPALDGLLQYATRTVPNIKTAAEAGMPGYAGETAEEAAEHMRFGQQVANELAGLYRSVGDESEARSVESAARAFDEAIASLDAAVEAGSR
jgi:hypothetical protein